MNYQGCQCQRGCRQLHPGYWLSGHSCTVDVSTRFQKIEQKSHKRPNRESVLSTPNFLLLSCDAPLKVPSKEPSISLKCEPLPHLGGTRCPPSSNLRGNKKRFHISVLNYPHRDLIFFKNQGPTIPTEEICDLKWMWRLLMQLSGEPSSAGSVCST